jgi:hypothetical protein
MCEAGRFPDCLKNPYLPKVKPQLILWQAAGLELGRQLVQERQGRKTALTAAAQLETALDAARRAGESACRT